jgi:hypothetical protein
VSAPRATACKLRLISGPRALREQPIVTDGHGRGVYAHPPARFGFTRPVSRVSVCTRLAGAALASGETDGYELSLRRSAGESVARLRVTPGMVTGEKEACVEGRFGEPVMDAELRVDPGGHPVWDWVYITRVELDG